MTIIKLEVYMKEAIHKHTQQSIKCTQSTHKGKRQQFSVSPHSDAHRSVSITLITGLWFKNEECLGNIHRHFIKS